MAKTEAVATLVTNYVEQRDAYTSRFKQGGGLIALSDTKQRDFSAIVDGFAQQLGEVLPPLSLEQWEGLSELVNSRLNAIRGMQR